MPVSIEHLMRVLLLNLGVDSLQAANSSLASQGYDVASNRGLAVDQVLALSPEVLVTEATPSDLSCCGLIAQLKARPETESSLKIVMVVQGGAVERARALDLGADDVISFPSNRWNLPPGSERNSGNASRKKSSRPCSSTPCNESISRISSSNC